MLKMLLALIVIAVLMVYPCYANPKWKMYKGSQKYGNAFVRVVLGLVAWVAVFSFLIRNYITGALKVAMISAVIIIVVLFIAGIRLVKDGYKPIYPLFLLLMASLGVWSRALIASTLIGIPILREITDYAQCGEAYWEIMYDIDREMSNQQKSTADHMKGLLGSILEEQDAAQRKREQEEELSEQRKREENERYIRREVWKKEGRTDVQFDEDGSRWKYADEDWHDGRKI